MKLQGVTMERIILLVLLFVKSSHTLTNDCRSVMEEFNEKKLCNSYYINNYRSYSYNDNYCRRVSVPIRLFIICSNTSWNISKPTFSVAQQSVNSEYRYDLQTRQEYQINSEDVETNLKVIESNIIVLPTSAFQKISNVKKIYLNNTNIQKIVHGAFNFQTKIQEIYLDLNNLTTITDGIFNSLTELKLLNLSFNSIETITENAFQGTQLSHLYLKNNKLKVFSPQMLSSLEYLTYLDLSFNKITEFEFVFSNSIIDTVLLNNNNIHSIKFDKFSIRVIDLSSNDIATVDNFDYLDATEFYINNNKLNQLPKNPFLETLDISYNLFSELNNTMLGTKLKSLYASHNLFTSLAVDTLAELSELENLSLSGNKLTEISNGAFKNNKLLKFLDISLNQLTDFSYGTFDNLDLLSSLNISFNNFETISLNIFHSLTNLSEFYIQGNKIQSIDINDLRKYMPNLRVIDIDGNPWSCKNLSDFVHVLKQNEISFSHGRTNETNTVFGMECSKENQIKSDNGQQKTGSFSEESFYKSALFRYFDKDFERSKFYKYLESFNNTYSNLLNNYKIDLNKSDTNTTKYLEDLNNILDNFFKTELEFFKINTENFGKMINITSQDFSRILENFKAQQIEMTNEFKSMSDISSNTSDMLLNKLQQENNSSKIFFSLLMEKLSSMNSVPKLNYTSFQTLEKSQNFENIVNEKLVQTNGEDLTQNIYRIEIFILLFLIGIMFILSVAVFIIFNAYRRFVRVNLSELELGQLIQSKSQDI